MKFANPVFFWALLSLAVPILIHLFNFRKFRTVYFTNVRFLRELKQETQSRSRLRHLLVLIARCLMLASLVIAFTQPFIPVSKKTTAGERAVSIYIDNSFSMDAQGSTSSLLELAKKHALDIVQSYKPSDRFQVLTNDFESRHQRLLSREQFADMVTAIKPSPAGKRLSEIIERQRDLLLHSGAPNRIIYLLSDFQKTTTDLASLTGDSTISLNCVHLVPQLADNIALDSCWFESPYRSKGKPDAIQVRIRNHSAKRFDNVPLKLSINETQRGLESISLGPDSTAERAVSFTTPEPGFHSGEIQLTDYPVVFDDLFYFSYRVTEKIRVMAISGNGENVFLNQLYGRNAAFEFTNTFDRQIDYTALSQQQLIILNGLQHISSGLTQELKKYTGNGGTVLVFPSLKADLESYRQFSGLLSAGVYQAPVVQQQKVNRLNDGHRIYDDVFDRKPENVDLPAVSAYLPFQAAGTAREEYIMRLQNGDLFLAQYDAGKGRVYLCAVPLEEAAGNFPRHALFIPTLYKIALYSEPPARLYYTIGREEPVELANVQLTGDQTLRIKAVSGDFEIIPEHRVVDGKVLLYVRNQVIQAGNYRIMQGDEQLALVSFNYDRSESSNERLSEKELETMLEKAGWPHANILDGAAKELKQTILQLDEGRPLWKLFIILALVFLATEILLIRFLK